MSDDAWFAENPEAEAIAERAGTYDGDRRIFIAARDIIAEKNAEIERLEVIVDTISVSELLKYPGPFRVQYFVDTLEIVDANGSVCKRLGSLVETCLNSCREATVLVKENER
jgi:hypothetical protein